MTTAELPKIRTRCQITSLTKWLRRPVQCARTATHMFSAHHQPEGCEGHTIAVCEEHTPQQQEALVARVLTLITAFNHGVAPMCGYCGKIMDDLDEAGDVVCLHS